MSSYYEEESIASINIIPFVDIILVILIIFMVTAPQLTQKGFSVRLPKSSSASKIKSSQLNVVVHHTGDIFLGGKLISIDDLSFHAKKITENHPSAKVVISADKSVSHGRVMEIVNTIQASGVQNFMFSTSSH